MLVSYCRKIVKKKDIEIILNFITSDISFTDYSHYLIHAHNSSGLYHLFLMAKFPIVPLIK